LAHDYPGDQNAYNMNSSADQARFAQQELQEHGYYHGKVDGKIGPATKAALRRFQQDNHLPMTASVDRADVAEARRPAVGDIEQRLERHAADHQPELV
jgi:peptidoglycan hydrolase-like protein with peptidoglycan-binding domain